MIAWSTKCSLAERVDILVVLKSPLTIPGTTIDGEITESCCQLYQEVRSNEHGSNSYITNPINQAADMMNRANVSSESDNYFNTFDSLMAYEHEDRNITINQDWRKIIVDTVCLDTVCGKDWIKDVLDNMDEKTKKLVRVSYSSKMFRFYGGERKPSLGEYILWRFFGGLEVLWR